MKKLIPLLLIPALLFFFGCSGSNNTTTEDTTAEGENTATDCSNGTIYGALEEYKTLLVTDSENPDTTYVFLGYDESQNHSWDILPALKTACDGAVKTSDQGDLRYFYILNSSEIIYGNFNCQNNTYLSSESGKIPLEDVCYED